MTIIPTSRRRPAVAIMTLVATGVALVPLVGPVAPAQARVTCDPAYDGTPRADRIIGDRHTNFMCGRGGGDTIRGRRNGDVIFGGPGRDLLHGEIGSDNIFGGRGGDAAEGGDGPDSLFGGPGEDFLGGGPGDDQITLDLGGGIVYGDGGDDLIYTDNGWADTVYCGDGTDEADLDVYDSYVDCESIV